MAYSGASQMRQCWHFGSKKLPDGAVARTSNMEMRPLWNSGNLEMRPLWDSGKNNSITKHQLKLWSIGRAKKKEVVNKIVAKGVAEKPTSNSDSVQIKFDVFVSFRGEDIRQGFLGHLINAFVRKQINAFVDEKLKRGNDISNSLIEAIEGSFISLIIFSENYASSRWCLEELVKIVECKEKYGQIIIPIFYGVDPSDVRHQKNSYGNALVEHEKKYSMVKVQLWKNALNKTANLSGIKSLDFRNDAELLEEIINLVLMRLSKHHINPKGLIGIGKPIAHLESLLQQETEKVRVIGIWGMGGIGKTTIAEEIFNQNYSEYEGCCFLEKVSEELERHGIQFVKEKLFSTLLAEQVKIDTPNGLSNHIMRRIGRMKVLIVLDDVKEEGQLEMLFGTLDWFGSSSRIIITTRDKHVLIANEVDDICEVGILDSSEALELFNLNAFKQNQLETEYYELSKRFVSYANGIPLVLKVLGRFLRGKGKQVWESQLDKLKKMPSKKVYDVMRLSYDDLDRVEQKIFLDIACFFNGLNVDEDYIKDLLKDSESDSSVIVGLERLKDKALVTITDKCDVSMHEIIQEMGREIVRQESSEDPGNRSRLWDSDDICEVLNNDKGTEAIRSIRADSTTIRKLKLSPHIFVKMRKLKFLHFNAEKDEHCLDLLPHGLQYLPPCLRFVHWKHFPLKSLPEKFSAENIVLFELSYSRLETLWSGVQNLVKLRDIRLMGSEFLKELPDFSKATNLVALYLSYCTQLKSVHPSIFSLNKLALLDLTFCISLTNIPKDIHLSSLHYLSLAECQNLWKFYMEPEQSGIRVNALPSYQSKLEILVLIGILFENLPSWIINQTRLKFLDLRFCSNLKALTELPSSLDTLLVEGCDSLRTVSFPSMVVDQFKQNREEVSFCNCLNLDEHILKKIELNSQINLMKYAYQHLFGKEHDYVEKYTSHQAMYVYPGSSVPKWLEYKSTKNDMIIDLSIAQTPPLGFIFCFILSMGVGMDYKKEFKVTIIDDEGVGEDNEIKICLDWSTILLKTDHVCIIYNQQCSHYISSRATHQARFKIKATLKGELDIFNDQPGVKLKGFGVSTINPSTYINFKQQMELFDYINKLSCIMLSIILCISFQQLRMKNLI